MTENEWLTGTNPQPLLEFVNDTADYRKLRLFHVASCGESLRLTSDEHLLRGIQVAEQLAEGEPEPTEVAVAFADIEQMIDEAQAARWTALEDYDAEVGSGCGCPRCEADAEAHSFDFNPTVDANFGYRLLEASCTAGALAVAGDAIRRALAFPPLLGVSDRQRHWTDQLFLKPSNQQLIELLHEVFGNPFRRVVLQPFWLAWNDCCVERIAQRIDDERRFADLPILADALEDAGCDNADILAHCRSDRPHVKGCWVIDLLLGKA